MDLSHVFDVIIFLTNDLELFFEEFNSFLLWDMTFLCVVGFFDEVNEGLRLDESFSKSLLVLRSAIFLEVEDLVSCGLLSWLAIKLFSFIEVLKVVYQIKEKVKEKLFDAQREFAQLEMVPVYF